MTQIFRDTSLSIIHVFVKKEIDVLLTVSLNYISCLDCSSKSLFNRFAGCCCFQSYMNRMQDCSSTQNTVYIKEFKRLWSSRSKLQTKMIPRPLPTRCVRFVK